MQVWKDITDELNATYTTSFSVEQYKKKLQNVQCTSRQKLQTGRGRWPGKNTRVGPGSRFSAAESEFIRLFEDHNGVFDSFRHDSGASSVDVMADSDPSNIKVEDFLSSLGFNNFNTSIFDSTTTPNGDSNGDEGENFNKQLLTKLGQLGQQILEQHGSFAALNVQPVLNNDPAESAQISPATSSSNDPVVTSENSRKRENPTQDLIPYKNGLAQTPHEPSNQILLKRRRKAVPVENGHHDDSWKNELLEVQKKILENQEKILKSLDERPKEVLKKEEDVLKKVPNPSYEENKLNALFSLGNKLDRLCDVVSSLEKTIQSAAGRIVPSEP
uniref:Uncharacterized protein n=1 Tax=Acrobeloides nanus TaxID=290746 RepID=A0A914DJP8_9BILA